MTMETTKYKRSDIELRDQMLEQSYALLKRTAQKEISEADCSRWTILWTLLHADESYLEELTNAVISVDLEGRRRLMGRKVEA